MWVECRRAFLFSMANPSGLGSTKLPLTGKEQSKQYAIKCHSCHGPAFGVGHDLYISTNANTKSSTSCSYSWLGHSYQCPSGQQQRTFFTGATSFLCYRLRGVFTQQVTTIMKLDYSGKTTLVTAAV